VPDPGFPIYESVVGLVGGVPVPYPVFPDDGARLDDAIAASITARTRLLVLNLPGNPAGSVASPAALDAVAELAIRHDLAVLSDEIYSRLYFDGAHESIASRPGLAERTILVDGFSKAYAMTGWRLGYGVMPARLAERVAALVINSTSCAPAFVQLAGLAALTGPQQCVADLVSRLRARRDAVVRGLNVIPHVQCASPAAAFYAFPDVTRLLERSGLSTAALARILLDVYGLAALAGSSFGARGEGHVRLSFATSPELLAAALERLAACAYDLSSARQRS
jgi:aspartate/methionine/tyrosine aminotransferase